MYIKNKPKTKNIAWFLKYLRGSLYLYSAHIYDDDKIIKRPNDTIKTTLIIKIILSRFIISPHILMQ